MSTPIRLVKNNGGTIDLLCTTLTMNVQRGVSPITMPFFGGSRLGFDLNTPSTVISMEGIIADDDKLTEVGGKSATALINFENLTSVTRGHLQHDFSTSENIDKIIDGTTTNNAGTATHAISLANITNGSIYFTQQPTNFTDATCDTNHTAGSGSSFGSNPKIIQCDSTELLSVGLTVSGTGIATNSVITQIDSDTLFRVDLDTTATNNNQTLTFTGFYGKQRGTVAKRDRPWVALYNSTTGAARTTTEIGTAFAALVNQETTLFNMTATLIDSNITDETNVAVKLTQSSIGVTGNVNQPSFGTWPSVADKPWHQQFSGGSKDSTEGGRSAGDRVAELYATLCNSNNGGAGLGNIVSGILTVGGNIGNDILGGGGDNKYGDYIIGLQIPFTSSINDNSSLFYMPTGAFKAVSDKTADNALPVGTEFSSYNGEYTGIKGTIADATFVQLGGEPIYSFTINFVPIDWII